MKDSSGRERSFCPYLCELLLPSIEEWKDSRRAKHVQLCGEASVADRTLQSMYGALIFSPNQGLTLPALLEAQLCRQLRGLSKHSGLRMLCQSTHNRCRWRLCG